MTQPLKDPKGAVMKDDTAQTDAQRKADPGCAQCEPLSLGRVCALALRMSTMIDPELSGRAQAGAAPVGVAVQKAMRAHLADTIETNPDASLSTGEIETLKKALNVVPLSGTVMVAVLPIIDPVGWERALEDERKK